jgi:elongation factor G
MNNLEKLRNIGIIAHIDAGKTTTTERILYLTGRIHRMGNVDDGNTTTDYMDQERERGITIVSATTAFDWNGFRVNLIDTPGHVDFTAEVERSLRVLDGVVIVVCGVAGVQPQTETVWRQADRYSVPRIISVNKMDRVGANLENAIQTIREKLGANPIPIQVPIGAEGGFRGVIDVISNMAYIWGDDTDGTDFVIREVPEQFRDTVDLTKSQLIEALAETDEDALSIFIEKGTLTKDQIMHFLRRACIKGLLVPVVCTSAYKYKGMQPLLTAITDYMPSPLDIPPVKGINPATKEEVERKHDPSEPLCALVFKVVTDKYLGTLSYVRVYSGELCTATHITNATTGKKERVMRCLHLFADHREDVPKLVAGDIGGVLGLKNSHTGNTLHDPSKPVSLEQVNFPDPVISETVEPKTRQELDKVVKVLNNYAMEDPTFTFHTDDESGEMVISGMGELHLDIIVTRMKLDHDLDVRTGQPRVAYKETISKVVKTKGRYVKQTGGKGQYGDLTLKVYPTEEKDMPFEINVGQDKIPEIYHKHIKLGVEDALVSGTILGYPVIGIGVEVIDGSFHEVDSSVIAFRQAASIATRDALKKADPMLLEPIMRLQVVVPDEYLGDVMAGLNKRRSKVQSVDLQGKSQVISAHAPLSEMFGYATYLRSATQGRGTYTMEFLKMKIMPPDIMEKVVLSVRGVPWQH